MKKITKKQFLADVRHEIDMLKLHATDEEKSRLDFSTFDPSSTKKCIYGQITNDCQSPRAKVLMDLSCIRVFDNEWTDTVNTDRPLSSFIQSVNGDYTGQDWRFDSRDLKYISVLEGYIWAKDAKNKQIIAYIKGETNTLTL